MSGASQFSRASIPGAIQAKRRNRTAGRPAIDFFEATVLSFTGDDCLLWPFSRDIRGYGMLRYKGQHRYVSRWACEAVNGLPADSEMEAAHECGKGHLGCVNPRHISWKSRAENSADKRAHGTHLHKLTVEEVREIRSLHGVLSHLKLAARFGVSKSTVRDILSGKKWAWAA